MIITCICCIPCPGYCFCAAVCCCYICKQVHCCSVTGIRCFCNDKGCCEIYPLCLLCALLIYCWWCSISYSDRLRSCGTMIITCICCIPCPGYCFCATVHCCYICKQVHGCSVTRIDRKSVV